MTKNSVEETKTNLNDKNTSVEQRKTFDSPAGIADVFREGSFEIKTQAEIPVISKTARIVEEVVISKQMTEHPEIIRDSVKKTVVEVSEIADDGTTPARKNG